MCHLKGITVPQKLVDTSVLAKVTVCVTFGTVREQMNRPECVAFLSNRFNDIQNHKHCSQFTDKWPIKQINKIITHQLYYI